MDSGTCMLIAPHKNRHNRNIYVPGIIRSGLCFMQPLIFPNLKANHPDANANTSSDYLKKIDPKFRQQVKVKSLKLFYDFQQH